MSARSPLHRMVRDRFNVAFGAPSLISGEVHHWSLEVGTYASPVHVLANGTPDYPVVWVFDPHTRATSMHNIRIGEEHQIGPIIDLINECVQAGKSATRCDAM